MLLLGRYGKKVPFYDGASAYSYINNSGLNFVDGDKVTFEVLVKDQEKDLSRRRDIMGKSGSSWHNIILMPYTRKIVFQAFYIDSEGNAQYPSVASASGMNDRSYHHIIIEVEYYSTYAKVKFYIDSRFDNEDTLYYDYPSTSTNKPTIGKAATLFTGPIPTVRIYNRLLSDHEIRINYIHAKRLEPTPVRDGLLVELVPDTLDCDNGVWNDNSGNGNNAVLNTGRCIEI
ncbi:MAG: LamG domain-containing protein [Desulfurococcales archaeon]|nr:LamG domain-containing protein [Desulfurococcales archaeon]